MTLSNSDNATLAPAAEFPAALPLLTMPNQVVFPMAMMPMSVSNATEVTLLEETVMGHKFVVLLTLRDPRIDNNGLDNAFEIGVIGRILQFQRQPDDSANVLIQALKRCHVEKLIQREPYRIVQVKPLEDTPGDPDAIAPLATTVKNQMSRLIALAPSIPDAAQAVIDNIEDPGFLADLVASNLNISIPEKQRILSEVDRKRRLERLTYILAREVELMELSDKIQNDVKSAIDKGQREFFLRQQLKAIQRELGEGDPGPTEAKRYREKIEALALKEDVKREVLREADRLEQMNESSAEYHVITTYLDWIVDLPWNVSTEDRLDIARAETILNEDHYGLDKVKRRILEYLAVRKLKPDATGPILCFVGPPGVGKTSLGQSIARALGRNFAHMSLGGMRDEAEIRGHRKTYVGALPGRIMQHIRKARSNNPVFMLDEIDKVGSDFRGDPSSALLEVLDPAQNHVFADLYLNVPFDLSRTMFIATANMLDTIPWALRDRMEIIEIPGYTAEEKLHIARKYLIPKQIHAHGIPSRNLKIAQAAVRKIISSYTQEAGVRNLDREIANVCRGCARLFADGQKTAVIITPENLSVYLGRERVFHEAAERASVPGVATGLAWTVTGGDILFIEATRVPGKGGLMLTGQLGDVMKESAQAVMSYVRANARLLGIPDEDFSTFDIHIHVPAGAVPKDGPSAGVAILAAVTSLLTGKKVKPRVAMTGEITLRGLVLPVGGIKEKVLAAARAGIRTVILPQQCERDLDDVPASAKNKLTFRFVRRMEEALDIALGLRRKISAAPSPRRR